MPNTTTAPFSLRPSRFDWQIVVYGGVSPRTGQAQGPLDFQFYKQTRPGGYGYSARSIIARAESEARQQHRTHFAVRDTDGTIIHDGPVRDALGRPTASNQPSQVAA